MFVKGSAGILIAHKCIQIYSIEIKQQPNLLNTIGAFKVKLYNIDNCFVCLTKYMMYQSKLIKINKPKNLSPGSNRDSGHQVNVEAALEYQKTKNKSLADKYNKSEMKVKYLIEQLNSTNSLRQLPEGIQSDVLEIDTKIQQLQEQLYFKKSKKMDQLRSKIKYTFELIKFDVDQQSLKNVKDQVQLILLILQVIEVRYNQITDQKLQIHEAVQNLKNSNTKNQFQQILQKAMTQNKKLVKKIKTLQNQLSITKDHLQQMGRSNSNKNLKSDRSQRTIDGLKSNLYKLQQKISVQEVDLQKKNRKLIQVENQIISLRKRLQISEQEQERIHKDEVKWRERYRLMQNQKNQRITILQQQISKLRSSQFRKTKNSLQNQLQRGMKESSTLYYDF